MFLLPGATPWSPPFDREPIEQPDHSMTAEVHFNIYDATRFGFCCPTGAAAVGQMNRVTQQVAANAEESSGAAEELAGQVLQMLTRAGAFHQLGLGRALTHAEMMCQGEAAALTRTSHQIS